MLSKAILLSLLTAVMAVPAPDPNPDLSLDSGNGEVVKFKRDMILENRDLELAEAHGVNLTEMYKHSLIKRDDGDHTHIWVSRQFVESDDDDLEISDDDEDEEDLVKRAQKSRLANGARLRNGFLDQCHSHSRNNINSASGAYSGGVEELKNWASKNRGHIEVDGTAWSNLVVAGSNSGANALYRVSVRSGGWTRIGTDDIRSDASWAYDRRKKFPSAGWRAAASGRETCAGNQRINFEVIKTRYRV